MRFGVEHAERVQAPKRLDRPGTARLNLRLQRGSSILLAAIDQEPLRGLAPEQIIAVHRRHKLGFARAGKRFDFRLRRLVPHHAVDPPVSTVAVRVDVRVAFAILRVIAGTPFARRRVVLDDEVVPVRHPQVPVRTDLRRHWREPLIGRGQKGISVLGLVARPVPREMVFPEQMPGRPANERHLFAERLRESRRSRHSLAGTCGVVIESVHLANVGRNRVERAVGRDHLRTHALLSLAVGGGADAAEEARVVVGGRAKYVAGRVETEPPSVVVELVHKLQLRSVRLHAEHPGSKALLLAADRAVKGRVSHGAPDPVVESIAQVRRTGMRVADPPPRRQNLAHVGFVIPVGVLQE